MKVIYHNDFDGKASAAIIAKYHRERGDKLKIKDFIEINYNKQLDIGNVWTDELVYIVDYSLKPEEWDMVQKNTSNLIWIDHHISAIQKYSVLDRKLNGIRRDGTAACELTWEFFYPLEDIPYAIKLLGDYDVWAHQYGSDTINFQNGLKAHDTHPLSDIWNNALDINYKTWTYDLISYEGNVITSYIKKEYAIISKSYCFEVKFEGLNALVCNSHERQSSLFDAVYNEEKHDIMIPFIFDGDNWVFSLYTIKDDIDCSVIATKYGGGGHKKAAGFVSSVIPWIKPKV
jgi:oligoribonuclease NrnB/cAMP/cGMP phosphodiesterase (DHH superfamily)